MTIADAHTIESHTTIPNSPVAIDRSLPHTFHGSPLSPYNLARTQARTVEPHHTTKSIQSVAIDTSLTDSFHHSSYSPCTKAKAESRTIESHTTKLDPSVAIETSLIHTGKDNNQWISDRLGRTVVNPPVYHASTFSFPNMAALRAASKDRLFTGMWYGRHGTPTAFALESAYASIEGAYSASVTASGVAAVTISLMSFVRAGDHILVTDGVYDAIRNFCDNTLKRFGVEIVYFSPTATPDDVEALVQSRTKLILFESPTSLSFEITDVPGIAARMRKHGIKVILDNSWGPTLFSPFQNGCDVSISSVTKYIGGHSDLMMGIICSKDEETYRTIKRSIASMGIPPGADDAYLAMRGLRTLGVRLKHHERSALSVANWLQARPEVARVMHPGLKTHPQHALFKKLFNGSNGLFGFQLRDGYSEVAIDAFIDGLQFYTIGFSWGGFGSLLMVNDINSSRTVDTWKYGNGYGRTFRIHIGLEHVDDLIKDLEEGFGRLSTFKSCYCK